jgi:hypothetical protein
MRVQCVLYPDLEIDEDARVFVKETGKEIIPQLEHSLSINGPVVYYRKDGKTRNLSLRSLYFAAHIKGCKITRGDTTEPVNGDYYDLRPQNFYTKKPDKIIKAVESYSCWMNGSGELFC